MFLCSVGVAEVAEGLINNHFCVLKYANISAMKIFKCTKSPSFGPLCCCFFLHIQYLAAPRKISVLFSQVTAGDEGHGLHL